MTGTITHCMIGMNAEKSVGTAARPLTVVPGVATKIEIELNCPDLQEAPPCADTDKSVQEEIVSLELGVGTSISPPKVGKGVARPEEREEYFEKLTEMPQCGRTAKTTQCENGMPVRMGLGTAHATRVA